MQADSSCRGGQSVTLSGVVLGTGEEGYGVVACLGTLLASEHLNSGQGFQISSGSGLILYRSAATRVVFGATNHRKQSLPQKFLL